MKTNKFLFTLLGIVALTINAANVHAQCTTCFDVATVVHIPYNPGSTPGNVLNTGNDVNFYSGATYEVSVWDGDYPSLGWDINYSGSPGTVLLGNSTITDALDPDVCLVEHSSTVYALVVYYSLANTSYYLEIFYWTGSAFSNIGAGGLTAMQSSSCFGYTVNIDSDNHNVFAIVWDKLASCPSTPGDVYCMTGNSISAAPALDQASPVLINPSSYRKKMPDVAVHYNGSRDSVLIAYVVAGGANQGDIEVNHQSYSDLAGSTSSVGAYYPWSASPFNGGAEYSYPRIASVYYTSSGEFHWSVMMEEFYSGGAPNYYIVGYTLADYITYPNPVPVTYNDGNAVIYSPIDISAARNFRPAVAFDNTGDSLYVGWTFDNKAPTYNNSAGALQATYPIVLHLNIKGELVLVTPAPTYVRYWEVPNPLVSSNTPLDSFSTLSIAGRFVNDNLYTFYGYDQNSGHQDVFYKQVSQSTPPLRQETFGAAEDGEFIFYPNPYTSSVEVVIPNGAKNLTDLLLNIYDITGKEIFNMTGNGKSIAGKISLASTALERGMYFFKITSESEAGQRIQKLVKL